MQPSLGNKNNKNIVYMRSRQSNNHKNHVSYYSNNLNSVRDKNEINQTISRNNQIKKELELDHPKPLITDYDEDINELKTQFYTKSEKNNINTNQNLKDLPQENQEKNTKNKLIYSDKENISNNENINSINMNDESKIDKDIKINNVNSENKAKGENLKNNSKFNNNGPKNYCKNYSIKTFDRRNISSNDDTNYKNIEKDFQTIGKSTKNENNNNEHIFIKSHSIIKNQNTKNKNNQRLKIYPSTACLNTSNTSNINQKEVARKTLYQKRDKKNINQQIYKYYTNKINTNYPKSTLNINLKNISQYINTHNNQILHKLKEENSSNKENIINSNKLNSNKNPFINYENFNNTKTTVVVFSKKIRPILKVNVIPNYSKKNNNKNIIGQKSATNIILNNSKNKFYGPYSLREEDINPKKRKIGIKKNQNSQLLFLDRNNFEMNYINFINSSKTENNKSLNDEISIKNSTNNKQRIIIPSYDYNYDYSYYYGNGTFAHNKNSIGINYNSSYIGNFNY